MSPSPQAPDTKNLALAIALSLAILLGFQYFYEGPRELARQKKLANERAAVSAQAKANPAAITATPAGTPAAVTEMSRPQALAQTPRFTLDSSAIDGTISTLGARFDDVRLKRYKETIQPGSKEITLLHPQGTADGYYAFFGFKAPDNGSISLPGPNTVWAAPAGAKLTPTTPVTLTYDNGQGLKFARTISVDNNYLFTVKDVISNTTAAPVTIQPYGAIRRHSKPKDLVNPVIHEGAVGVLDNKLAALKYPKMEKGEAFSKASTGGWLGMSDKFWFTALIPDQKAKLDAEYKMTKLPGEEVFETSFEAAPQAILAGQSLTTTQHLYAGAKNVADLKAMGQQLGVAKFEDAVDWGLFWFLTKPFYAMLVFFTGLAGKNVGLGILIMTVVVKVATFPLVFSSYKSFARMRELTPKLTEMKAKFPDDPARQQQETMKLYKEEKINPVAGCIPSLLTMPIFFALFKVLSVALELRHTPFYGWIPDLSAKDPTSFLNLFGLIPFYNPASWDVASMPIIGGVIMIGAWPILYGISFWLQMKMQPAATDPVQAQVFALMPWMFVFVFAGFGSGLVIYYTWSNLLTILQQYVIAKVSGNSTPIDEFFAKLGKKKPA